MDVRQGSGSGEATRSPRGWFAEETTVPLPQYLDAERDRWIDRHIPPRSIGQESVIDVPALRCEVQEQVNPP
ncbi:hypothetical protein [Methanoculleus chikugoensis]|uniref:hypothetical protein n=1 Tax=Methanoculleus chikugoensis TaxID=118126 RepID=UPI001FB53A98|nr:hypothetical protein [Methanoculleus chikugoensis]